MSVGCSAQSGFSQVLKMGLSGNLLYLKATSFKAVEFIGGVPNLFGQALKALNSGELHPKMRGGLVDQIHIVG